MGKALYYMIFILEFVFFLLKKLCGYMFLLCSHIWKKLYAYRCELDKGLEQTKKSPKGKEERVMVQHITMQTGTASMVGKTKTEFLSQADLPRFTKNEVIASTPLEREIISPAQEEPDIDPRDVDVATTSDNRQELKRLLEEENDDPDLYDELSPDDDLSMAMGVVLEELDETFETLKKEDCTHQEKEKAKSVFRKIEGTAFLQFYLMQNECMERAKICMQEIDTKESSNKDTNAVFDVSKYV